MTLRTLAPITLLFLTSACASTMAEGMQGADTSRFRGMQVDPVASEITFLDEGAGPTVETHAGDPGLSTWLVQERERIAEAMSSTFGATGGPGKARFQVAMTSTVNLTTLGFPCLVLLTLIGCPVMHESVEVDLVLDAGGKTYKGHGEGGSWGVLFDLETHQPAVGRALADALQHAREGAAK